LRLRLEGGGFTLVVEDNGQGLPGVGVPVNGHRLVSGHGMNNLERRLKTVGGHCNVFSAAGHGTRVEMAVGAASSNPASPVVAIARNGVETVKS
ncbi:MAG TPA: hypothetical protein VLT36_14745, partial [Candidatus Dormibacteraeota bacterium]|nr:hypothetical protein [Candidatus Dormibacteraeota bacterium]